MTEEKSSGRSCGSSGSVARRVRTAAPQASTRSAPTGFASVAPKPSDPGRCAGNVKTVKAAMASGRRDKATATKAAASSAYTAYFGEYTARTPSAPAEPAATPVTALCAFRSSAGRERANPLTPGSGTLRRWQRVFGRKEVIPGDYGQVARIALVGVLSTPPGPAPRGDEETKRCHTATPEQFAQLSEFVPARVAHPDAHDDRLARVGESDRFRDLRQRRRVDHDDIAFPAQAAEQLLDPPSVEEMELVHLLFTRERQLEPRVQRRGNGTGPRRIRIVQQVDDAVPVTDDVEHGPDHGPGQVGIDQGHVQTGAAERNRQIDSRQRLPIPGAGARYDDRCREAVALSAGVREDGPQGAVCLPGLARKRSVAEKVTLDGSAGKPRDPREHRKPVRLRDLLLASEARTDHLERDGCRNAEEQADDQRDGQRLGRARPCRGRRGGRRSQLGDSRIGRARIGLQSGQDGCEVRVRITLRRHLAQLGLDVLDLRGEPALELHGPLREHEVCEAVGYTRCQETVRRAHLDRDK